MKALVVGGSGFVGSHVADALSEAGHEVTVFDLRPYKYLRPDQRFLQGDMLNPGDVARAVAGQEVVYNFAGLGDIEECQTRPVDTVRINIVGNALLLDAARQAEARRYIFASTIYVYSASGGFYRASKQACELYIEEYQRQHGLDYVILRYGTLYGRRADDTNAVHSYLKQALLQHKILYYGTGEELREYVHVEDAARSSVTVLGEDYRNQYVIVTGHHPMKAGDLMAMIREIIGPEVEVEYRPPQSRTNNLPPVHYNVTPYSFRPKLGKKLVSHYFVDMGQGLLDVLQEIHAQEMVGWQEGAGPMST